jgi:hypothetical protein
MGPENEIQIIGSAYSKLYHSMSHTMTKQSTAVRDSCVVFIGITSDARPASSKFKLQRVAHYRPAAA